jgi:hypothetical protein
MNTILTVWWAILGLIVTISVYMIIRTRIEIHRCKKLFGLMSRLNHSIYTAPLTHEQKMDCWDRFHVGVENFDSMVRKVSVPVEKLVKELRDEVFQDVLDSETNV